MGLDGMTVKRVNCGNANVIKKERLKVFKRCKPRKGPQDWRSTVIVILYKGKDNEEDGLRECAGPEFNYWSVFYVI